MADAPQPRWMTITAYVFTAVAALGLAASASMKLMHAPEMVQMFTSKFGYPESLLTTLGIVELTVALLYVIPRTSIVGAILATGYLGGAVATHVRVGDVFIPPLLLGIFVWLGLGGRSPAFRALLASKIK